MLTALDKLVWERADQAVLNFHSSAVALSPSCGNSRVCNRRRLSLKNRPEVPVSGSKSVDRHGGWHHVSRPAGVIVGERGSQTEISQNQEQQQNHPGNQGQGWAPVLNVAHPPVNGLSLRLGVTLFPPGQLATRQQTVSRQCKGVQKDDWIEDGKKRFVAYRDCDFLVFVASSGPVARVLAAAGPGATVSLVLLPSGARDLRAADSGAFFRRTLGRVSSDESEFRRPVTNSRSDDTELSLLRLFRPLQPHDDLCGGRSLLISAAMVSILRSVERDATMRSAAGYCRAGIAASAVHPPVGLGGVVSRFNLSLCRV